MSNNENELVKEFNKAGAFFKELSRLKQSKSLSFEFKLYKAFGDLSVKTDIPVMGPCMLNPKLDIGITKTGKFTVYGDYNEGCSYRKKNFFEDPKEAAVFVANKALNSL